MIAEKIGYSYNDLTIVPKDLSRINSRSECDVYTKDGNLPIFVAPMSSVISDSNYEIFIKNKVLPIIPRTVDINKRLDLADKCWIAVSLKEFEEWFINTSHNGHMKVCIDIANGHIKRLIDLCKAAKEVNDQLKIMIGNIANPYTYHLFTIQNARGNGKIIDYVRCGIGAGAGCITSSNTGVHYPMASLISECSKLKNKHYSPYLIADGGIRNYSDVIKALALGADYVMIGSLFAKCLESAGAKMFTNYKGEKEMCSAQDAYELYEKGAQLYTRFYGMASADGQIAICGKKTKTAEGIVKMLPVEYKLATWIDNMESYLKSAMSYCDSYSLEDFIGKQILIINSVNTINSVNK